MPISIGVKATIFNGVIALVSIVDMYKMLNGIKKNGASK
jgi:hypothetical protein|tara:strand:+ start:8 stop:124 length:117 start_codon:yes stop_codon:yes gene_type:complete